MSGFDRVVPAPAVVVGAGVAGLSAALGLGNGTVIVTKARLGEGGSTGWAQGGVAAALGPDDSPRLHAADTVAVAAGLADPAMVEILTCEGPGRVRALMELGAELDRTATGEPALGLEAGHSRRRILHADGDRTGAEVLRALTAAARRAGLRVAERTFAVDVVVADGRVAGLSALGAEGESILFVTPAVILATGGVGRLYRRTTNPVEVTGDGLAMAARAGARLADLEFVQFHPTALDVDRDPMPLLTEALRGEGAALVDGGGTRFMTAVHPDAELAPRDIVARAIWSRVMAGEPVYLDARAAVGAAFPDRFPTVFELCREAGIDPRLQPLPVAPAAHYHMGGVATDEWGRTSLPGLWAAGEAAATGVHGGNRLASNSLLEGLVFGARVARSAPPAGAATAVPRLAPPRTAPPAPELVERLRTTMDGAVGLVRDEAGLEGALAQLAEVAAEVPPGAGEAANMALAARLITTAALTRRESRGAHYRRDHPEAGEGGRLVFEGVAVLEDVAA